MTNKLENVDLNSRKGISELSDKMEIERLLNDMVSWVAGQQS